jgi:predicted membrane-bound spermidine synthase
MKDPRISPSIHAGIFLITFSGLTFEIALTRIFSATIWYHFAFVAISVALLGWGVGGLVVHGLRKRWAPTLDKAALLALLYAVAIPFCLWFIVRYPFRPERLSSYFAAALVPFLLAGMSLSMVFDVFREHSARIYFADLVGASAGALAITFLLSWLGGEGSVLAVGFAPLLAAFLLSRRLSYGAGFGALALVAAIVLNAQTGFFKIRSAPNKGMYQHIAKTPGAEVALTGWNAYSRIDAVTGFPPPYLARLYIDSDAWTNILIWDGDLQSVREKNDWYRALPFRLVPKSRTLVIGPGGGSDVLVALASGAERVTAVEMNPLMLRFVRHFGAQAGNLYDQPKVETILSEGRNFISRTPRSFDMILLGFVDSWASVASGGLSLSENYLYTTEAFRAYYDHLSPDGVLVIMRWNVDIPRLVSNSVALLGAAEAAPRMVVLLEKRGTPDDPPQMMFMLKKQPFTPAETAMIADSWSLARPVILPGHVVDPPYADLLAGRKTLESYVSESPVRVDPVFDNRPFYFARQKPWGVPVSLARPLTEILVPVLILLVVFVAFGKPSGERVAPYVSSVAYFSCLGLGFIGLELALLQDLTLLLGHPIFTLSVLLFSLLASSGVGSFVSRRFSMAWACLAVGMLGIVYAFALPRLVTILLPLPLGARLALAVALVAPLGFFMGIPFPSGLRETGRGALPPPPFYWGLNGILSVVGSVGTVLIALILGFQAAMLLASCFYLLATAASRGMVLAVRGEG